jgi:tetratricopeptide (TPR) repeat protein
MMGWKQWGAAALVSATLWTGAFAAESSVDMLRDMFRQPVTEWKQTLRSNTRLLNEEFFTNVGKRIRWGIENNHVDDAFRFAMVGDFGAEATNRPANYRIDLAELFFKAENMEMAGQIIDNIRITSPDTAPAIRAQYIGAQIKERQKDLFSAYQDYVDLAESKRYMPEDTWYRAGMISLFVGEIKRAKEEFTKSGGNLAQEQIRRIEAEESGGFDSLPPVPNSPGDNTMPNTSGITLAPPTTGDPAATTTNPTASAGGDPLAKARLAVADNRLVDAIEFYSEVFDPQDAKVSLEYGAVLYRMGDLDQAKSVYDKALAKNAKDVELLRGRANTLERMYDRQGQRTVLDAALADYRQATSLAPDHQLLPWELTRAQSKS